MGKSILIIQGHPDPTEPHPCHALAEHYRAGAERAGHEMRAADLARLDFPLLRSQKEWEHSPLPAGPECWFWGRQTLGRKAD